MSLTYILIKHFGLPRLKQKINETSAAAPWLKKIHKVNIV